MNDPRIAEIPEGYRLGATSDVRKNTGTGRVILYCFIFLALFLLLFLIKFIPELGSDALGTFFVTIIAYTLPITMLYIFVYISARAATFKILTGARICSGFHGIHPYVFPEGELLSRKSAKIARLAPMIAMSVISAFILLIGFDNSLLYTVAAIFLPISVIAHIEEGFVTRLLNKFPREDVLVLDIGERIAILVPDHSATDPEEASREYAEWLADITPEEANERDAKGVSIIGILLLSVAIILYSVTVYEILFGVLYPVYENLFISPAFYALLVHVGLLIYFILTRGKHLLVKCMTTVFISSTMFIGFMFLSIMSPLVSRTTDIKNYGKYDEHVLTGVDLLPDEITEGMTPIRYSYYCDATWDVTYEIYLELRLSEDAYRELKGKYEDELIPSRLGDGYLEYVVSDKLPVDPAKPDRSGYPEIEKIVFLESERIAVFEVMYGGDPFYFENSAYIDRFDIDPSTYDDKAD